MCFRRMSEIHSEIENERYSIKHKVYKPSFREMISAEYRGQKEGDIITVLYDKKKSEIVMSDSKMEQYTNVDFARKANGDVLIAGLGIGMILLAIQDEARVKSITVVEIDEQLKDLVMQGLGKWLNNKVEIVICDINNYEPKKKFDTIYCDIWNNITANNYEEMKQLTNRFKNKINRENRFSFIDHWRKRDCKKLALGSW